MWLYVRYSIDVPACPPLADSELYRWVWVISNSGDLFDLRRAWWIRLYRNQKCCSAPFKPLGFFLQKRNNLIHTFCAQKTVTTCECRSRAEGTSSNLISIPDVYQRRLKPRCWSFLSFSRGKLWMLASSGMRSFLTLADIQCGQGRTELCECLNMSCLCLWWSLWSTSTRTEQTCKAVPRSTVSRQACISPSELPVSVYLFIKDTFLFLISIIKCHLMLRHHTDENLKFGLFLFSVIQMRILALLYISAVLYPSTENTVYHSWEL